MRKTVNACSYQSIRVETDLPPLTVGPNVERFSLPRPPRTFNISVSLKSPNTYSLIVKMTLCYFVQLNKTHMAELIRPYKKYIKKVY